MKRKMLAEVATTAATSAQEKRIREQEMQEERRLLCNRAARIARALGIPATAEQRDTGRRDVICDIEMNGHQDKLLIGVFWRDNHIAVLGPTTKIRSHGWVPVTKDLRTLPTVLKSELMRYAAETESINRLYGRMP